jgi:hypothetical protein
MEMSNQLHALAALSLGKNHSTHWTEAWVVPKIPSLDVLNKRKISCPYQIQTLYHPAGSLVTTQQHYPVSHACLNTKV